MSRQNLFNTRKKHLQMEIQLGDIYVVWPRQDRQTSLQATHIVKITLILGDDCSDDTLNLEATT